jgi:RNA polymerase sigma factor (sigma-70 family)
MGSVSSLIEKREILDLISAFQNGDDNAFSELVERYNPLLNKEIGIYTKGSIIPRELYIEACIGLQDAARSYESGHHTTFGLYAKKCIHNAILDFFKKNKTIRPDCDIDKLYVNPSIDEKLASAERFDSYMSKIKNEILSELEYKVFALEVYGYTTARIAEILSVTAKVVDNTKYRAHKKVRKYFEEHPED